MSTIYLHIGLEKTGTTSIQRFLIDNRIKLYDLGIFYPLTGILRRQGLEGSVARYGHLNLKWELEKLGAYDPHAGDWTELLREVDALKPEKIVISAETMSSLNTEQISQLKNLLIKYDVKILFCVRKQEDFLKSYYSQSVKAGRMFKTITKCLNEDTFYSKLNYYEIIKPWALNFGSENIKVSVFEQARKEGIIQSFLKNIDFDPIRLDDEMFEISSKENKSPSIKVIKVTRIVYIIMKKFNIRYQVSRAFVFRWLIKDTFISRIISKLPDFVVTDKLLNDSLRREIINKYKEPNRKLALEFLGKEELFNVEN